MTYLFDTNVPSELARERASTNVATFFGSIDRRSVFLSVMTIGEMTKGITALKPSRRRGGLELWLEPDVRLRFAGRILPVTEEIAER